jgi:predicted transcriptional regulator
MKTDTMNFSNIMEAIYGLSIEDKMEIITLLEHHVADVRRDEIAKNYKKSEVEHKKGSLKFSSKISELKKMI